jgi:hypothetical protein
MTSAFFLFFFCCLLFAFCVLLCFGLCFSVVAFAFAVLISSVCCVCALLLCSFSSMGMEMGMGTVDVDADRRLDAAAVDLDLNTSRTGDVLYVTSLHWTCIRFHLVCAIFIITLTLFVSLRLSLRNQNRTRLTSGRSDVAAPPALRASFNRAATSRRPSSLRPSRSRRRRGCRRRRRASLTERRASPPVS